MTTPKALARQHIDALLTAAGWVVQDRAAMNLGAGLGVAVREFPLAIGPADYLLFVAGEDEGGETGGETPPLPSIGATRQRPANCPCCRGVIARVRLRFVRFH